MCWRDDANNENGNTKTHRKACLNRNPAKKASPNVFSLFVLPFRPDHGPTHHFCLSSDCDFSFAGFMSPVGSVSKSFGGRGSRGGAKGILSSGVGGLFSFFICLDKSWIESSLGFVGGCQLEKEIVGKWERDILFASIPILTKQCYKFPDSDNWWQIFWYRIICSQYFGNEWTEKG